MSKKYNLIWLLLFYFGIIALFGLVGTITLFAKVVLVIAWGCACVWITGEIAKRTFDKDD